MIEQGESRTWMVKISLDILPCFEESRRSFEFSANFQAAARGYPEIMEVSGGFAGDAKIPSDFECFEGFRRVRGSEVGMILDTILKFPTIFGYFSFQITLG